MLIFTQEAQMNKIIIRRLKLADYSGVRQVDELTQYQYLGEKWKKFSLREKEKHLVSRRKEFGINVKTGYSLVATMDGKTIGFLFAYKTLPFHGALYIHHLAIEPNFQGKGVGALLYKELIRLAKPTKIKRIVALINLDNPKSMRLHEKLGFKLQDRKEAILEI